MKRIKAISISDRKGMRKENIARVRLIENFGLEDDAHGGKWHRQVSFLAQESIDTMRAKGLDVVAGNFAENITTEGFDLSTLKVGAHLKIGESELIISQLGKICHDRCAIYYQAGDCVMPREGIFGVVVQGGIIHVGDEISPLDKVSRAAAVVSGKETEEQWGEQLSQWVTKRFSPAFVRYDTVSQKQGGTVSAILEDLTTVQKVATIVIVDPSGSLGLALTGILQQKSETGCYRKGESSIYYCRTVDEVAAL
ncbi:MAG: MOSC domain-containing protein [Desulforhopalus sp.]